MKKEICDKIAPDLRLSGAAMKLIFPKFTRKSIKTCAALCRFALRGRWLGRKTRCRSLFIERPDSTRLRILLVTPKTQRAGAPGLLWLHGGGYGIGIPEQDFAFMDRFAAESGCTIVSPDYRLSFEAAYPAALEDCYTALLWLRDNSTRLGYRSDQLFVGGDSAGGGLTAALSLYARDKGEAAIAYQMPFYPMIDDKMTDSSRDNHMPVWDTASNIEGWKAYLGRLYGTENIPAYAAPARAQDLSGLPPTCTFVGTAEPFYDETKAYVTALKKAGVPVDFMEFWGAYHAFDVVSPHSPTAKRAVSFYMDSFRRAVKSCFAPQPRRG